MEVDPLDPSSTPKSVRRSAVSNMRVRRFFSLTTDASSSTWGTMSAASFSTNMFRRPLFRRWRNEKLLVSGTLYTAQFDDHGKGKWVELSPGATGMADPAEICIHTRLAASAVKATTMDRPEWVTANPLSPEAYCCLTYNKDRGRRKNKGATRCRSEGRTRAKPTTTDISCDDDENGDHGALNFTWDLFVVAGNSVVHTDARAGSANITPHNMFNAPDGLAFDLTGMLWIQTDGKYTDEGDFTGNGHNKCWSATRPRAR